MRSFNNHNQSQQQDFNNPNMQGTQPPPDDSVFLQIFAETDFTNSEELFTLSPPIQNFHASNNLETPFQTAYVQSGLQPFSFTEEQQQPLVKEEPTPSISPVSQFSANLSQFMTVECEQNKSSSSNILASPLLVVSIEPWGGLYEFTATIPNPRLDGTKAKWCYSKITKKLYVAKLVGFPVNITVSHWPTDAIILACPVYTKPANRMCPVTRCPNCYLADPSDNQKDHVLRIEGNASNYFRRENRHMVSVPLGRPAPGENSVSLIMRVACNTSCPGGPNRRAFSILLTLILRDREIGRQVIDVKCCEGPSRDISTDEKQFVKNASINNNDFHMETFRKLAADVSSSSKKRKVSRAKKENVSDNEFETIKIPKKYIKKVKRYVNCLHVLDQGNTLKSNKLFSETDSD